MQRKVAIENYIFYACVEAILDILMAGLESSNLLLVTLSVSALWSLIYISSGTCSICSCLRPSEGTHVNTLWLSIRCI